jgi:hypothetical protein
VSRGGRKKPPQIALPPSNGVWKRHGRDFVDFAVAFLFDAAKGALIIAGLFFFGWLIRFGKLFGLSDEYMTQIENLHFWFSLATYGVICMAFIIRLVRNTWNGK